LIDILEKIVSLCVFQHYKRSFVTMHEYLFQKRLQASRKYECFRDENWIHWL